MNIFLIPIFIIVLALSLDEPPAPPPPDPQADKVTLLPDENGVVGTVVVTTAAGQETLDTAYASVDVNTSGALTTQTESEASIQSRYGSLLDSTPPPPRSFSVNFVNGSATDLTEASKQTVAQMQTFLLGRPAPEISIIGHTDRVGSVEDNDRLSIERAQTVKSLIQSAGVSASSMEVAGRGEREPATATADGVPEASNRRVEISVR
jgi:OmpA-OmpF porin, OOP family